MSFVDLMGGDAWSEADIVNRMESMIRASYSAVEESIINRKLTGASLGMYTLNADEGQEVANYAAVCEQAQQAGRAARVDAALLAQVFPVERAHARLAIPAMAQPDPLDPQAEAAYQQDVAERAAAQADVDAASPATISLVAQRAAARPPQQTF